MSASEINTICNKSKVLWLKTKLPKYSLKDHEVDYLAKKLSMMNCLIFIYTWKTTCSLIKHEINAPVIALEIEFHHQTGHGTLNKFVGHREVVCTIFKGYLAIKLR